MAFTRILCILTVCCFTSLFAEVKAAAAEFTDCRDETTLLRSLERELAVVNTRRSTFDAIYNERCNACIDRKRCGWISPLLLAMRCRAYGVHASD